MSVTDATDATTSASKAVSSTVMSVAHNDPVGSFSAQQRVNQQQLFPSAVPNKFLNPISQSPVPQLLTSITLNDIRRTTAQLSDGLNGDPPPFAIFGFGYTGTNANYVSVELCTTIYIDGTDLSHAYPVGANIFISNWTVERIKNANTIVETDTSVTYNPNQANQDYEWLILKAYDSGADHTVTVDFYWRAILNTGGNKLPNT